MFDRVLTGKLRVLAVISTRRVPAFDANLWLGILGPANVPRDAVTRGNGGVNRIVKLAAIVKRFNELGVEPAGGGTPEEFAALHRSDFLKWQKVVRDARIKLE